MITGIMIWSLFHIRVRRDIIEFVEDRRTLIDDIKLSISLDQSRICAMQIKFWDLFGPEGSALLPEYTIIYLPVLYHHFSIVGRTH